MRENLAAVGQRPSEDDFYSIILGSLTIPYDPHISAINTIPSVVDVILFSDELMRIVTDEFDRPSYPKFQGTTGKGDGQGKDDGVAAAAKAKEDENEVAWFTLRAFDSGTEPLDTDSAGSLSSIILSENNFEDLVCEDEIVAQRCQEWMGLMMRRVDPRLTKGVTKGM